MTNADVSTAVTQENFETEVIEASFKAPVLVDFWAAWCGPCKMLMPVLEKLAKEANGAFKLTKVDTESEQQLAGMFGIRSLPTVVMIKDGRPVDGFMGAQPEGAIRAFLAKHITAGAAEPEVIEPDVELSDEDLPALIEGLRAASEAEPSKEELTIELADALARRGQFEQAKEQLSKLTTLTESEGASRVNARLHFGEVAKAARAESELERALAKNSADLAARMELGARFLAAGQYAAGFDQFLTVLKTDRKYAEDAGRRALLLGFKLAPDESLVSEYRRKLASALF
jgi:putative thioredoxin